MSNYVEKIYNGMIKDCAEEVHQDLMKNNEYIILRHKHERLIKNIVDTLPEDKKHLVDELDGIETSLDGIVEESYYEHGLNDGIDLLKKLKIV